LRRQQPVWALLAFLVIAGSAFETMAIELSSASALSFTSVGTATLSAVRRSVSSSAFSGIDDTLVTSGASAGRFAEVKVTLNRSTASQAVSIGVAAGSGIVAGLKELRSAFRLAGQGGLVSSETNLLDRYGSRVSVVNIQAQTELLLERVDALIDKAEFRGANLISSDGAVIRLQTSQFNGSITIESQPLDRAGLGLEDINLLEVGGIDNALAKLEIAIVLAEQRVGRLQSLQQGLDGVSSGRQFLIEALNGFGSSSLSRGALVDLIG
jgi:enamine deaminase RidA (YjgF/YER057c/UK114 family)